jgi:hypothetical protein
MNSIIKSDTHIRKHKDDFRKFSTEHEFDYTGYEYTIDNPAIPVCNPIEHSEITGYKNGDPSEHIAGLAFASGDKPDQIVTKIKASYDALISTLDEEVWADEVRAKVIGRDDSISDTMFMEELFSVYRNDTTDKDTIRVTSSYVMDAYKRFEKYQEKKRAVEKKKTEIEKNYKTLKKEIENTINTNKLNGVDIGAYTYTSGEKPTSGIGQLSEIQKNKIVDSINLYYKARVTQIERISDIHAMAFAAKLDAFKDITIS